MARVKIQARDEITERKVTLEGLTPLMTDRYAGDNTTQLEPWQKLYFDVRDGKSLGLPAMNIVSFLSAHNTNSAPKRLYDPRSFKKVANACLAYVTIAPDFIPLMRTGAPIEFGKLDGDTDPLSGVFIHHSVARLDKGIPNPKVRPVIPLPWSLTFTVSIYPNKEITEQQIQNLFDQGGRMIGLGTFRGVFGKFIVSAWD